jgi:catechol 2,3-dioxygenase-like lactoylglutathione lyase family enzyme
MSRIQLALNVADLDASIDFYRTMFDTEPHKVRAGYANFEITEPPLKLVLIEVPAHDRGHGVSGALNHLGIEESVSQSVAQHADRLQATGLIDSAETDAVCCYATQDKIWLHDPAGVPWEYYAITDDAPATIEPMRINQEDRADA